MDGKIALQSLSDTNEPVYIPNTMITAGGFIARGALSSPHIALRAAAYVSSLLADPHVLRRHPFDPRTRTGYTPPGIEGLDRANPNTVRHFFDYRENPGRNHESLASLYRELVSLGLSVLRTLDESWQTRLSAAARDGPHVLRGAGYLNEHLDHAEILFPAHVDFGLLTLFVGTGTSGLQVMAGGAWRMPELAVGDVLIGAGTLLRKLYPKAAPLRHRVIGAAAKRVSLFQFLEPSSSTPIPGGETADEYLTRVLKKVRGDH